LGANLEPKFFESPEGLVLVTDQGKLLLDFVTDTINYLRPLKLGKNELIAKAVGISKGYLKVLDVTAGLAQDAVVLARLGCQVTAIERSPWIYPLLVDAKKRAKDLDWINRIEFIRGDSLKLLAHYQPEVIYMDPMFPEKKKTALPRKEMQIFRKVVGEDLDSEALLELSLKTASQRVVVKRPLHAPELRPGVNHRFEGTSVRYDLYLCR
jgi:16S rRNA (guanine1516-N2)-methyltransferase